MEKDHQPDSMATVTIKPEYAPSEIYTSSEAPPAYVKNVYASVQVARIIATTIVLCSLILGFFILTSAYITANASCKQLEQELEILSEVADRFQGPLQPEALVQENPGKPKADFLRTDESKESNNRLTNNDIDSDSKDSDEDGDGKVRFKLPLQLNFDDLAGDLIEKNQRSKMNCIVEKKRAEQLIDHQPKNIVLPFGLNLTTDPRFEKVTGEKMAIFCESGTAQRANPSKDSDEDNSEDDQDEETIMIQPVMIPIPQSNNYQTHMAQQMIPVPPRMVPIPPQMLPMRHMMQQHQQKQQQPQQHHQEQIQIMVQPQFPPHPPHPMETMRPPQIQQDDEFPPSQILHKIAQQIITQKIMEQQQQQQQQQQAQQQQQQQAQQQNEVEERRIEIPQSILSRLPMNREVIVAIENNDDQQQQQQEPQEEQTMRIIQEQRTNPSVMNGRQTYARTIPIEQINKEQEQEPEAQATEEMRPHFVQPRSVRNKREVFLEKSTKRVKRCSCDCSC